MSDNKLYVGVDAGGTCCRARLVDSNGVILSTATGGPANFYQHGLEAVKNIETLIENCCRQASVSLTDIAVGLGAAGAELPESKELLKNWQHPYKNLVYVNDAHIACLGAHSVNGAILIVGTGLAGYRVSAKESELISGWGFPLADIGSAAWLGLRAIQQTLYTVEQVSEPSELTHQVLEFFDNDPRSIVSWAKLARSTDYGQLAPMVTYNWQNDSNSSIIIEQQIEYLSSLCVRLHGKEQLNVALMGGLSEFVGHILPTSVQRYLTLPQSDALDGAIRLIKEQCL